MLSSIQRSALLVFEPGVYCSFTRGLLVGQILVYRIYRQRIASSYVSFEAERVFAGLFSCSQIPGAMHLQ